MIINEKKRILGGFDYFLCNRRGEERFLTSSDKPIENSWLKEHAKDYIGFPYFSGKRFHVRREKDV
jgi:hypothetical protein